MALSSEICKKELLEYVANKNRVVHIVLTADEYNLKQRIRNDVNRRMKEVALNNLNYNIDFYNNNYKCAIHINTINKNIDSIADEIIKNIKNFQLNKL